MNVTVQSLKDSASRVIERATSGLKNKTSKPDLDILSQFSTNFWKAGYLLLYYIHRCFMRVVSLWVLFSYINNL
jgi:hypothetical protein